VAVRVWSRPAQHRRRGGQQPRSTDAVIHAACLLATVQIHSRVGTLEDSSMQALPAPNGTPSGRQMPSRAAKVPGAIPACGIKRAAQARSAACPLARGPWCSTGDNNQRPQDVNYSCLPAMAENWAAAGVDPALFRPKLPCVEAARLPIPARFKFAPPAHAAFLLHLLPLPNDRRHLKSQTTTLARQYPTQSPSTTYVNLQ
jgi:hypothetical protein